MKKEAMFYEKLDNNAVHCFLCPHHCRITNDGRGICGVRKNIGGTLYSLNYGEITSIGVDPIEKKPLHRFHPGTFILSAGSVGCNLRCPFCQNHSIARVKPEEIHTCHADSDEIVDKAISLRRRGNIGIAYTYNEPTIWYEFVYETAVKAKEKELLNVLVTNGYVEREPLDEILPYIDAMNIDLKAYNDKFYRELVKGGLEEVKETISRSVRHCHVEVTTLVIPGWNDSPEEMEEMAGWLASLSPDLPLHLSRYFPQYEMNDRPPTPLGTLQELKRIADRHLNYVYLGNI
ncbi:MAG TPA: AmmeMemoRadiSam system radical SAM enzyme [Anaerovoracaceae bacterium]|nr:AmmeMemoRadiSam system radical SAM enzyme [Anaerovoracaceae bacterium]